MKKKLAMFFVFTVLLISVTLFIYACSSGNGGGEADGSGGSSALSAAGAAGVVAGGNCSVTMELCSTAINQEMNDLADMEFEFLDFADDTLAGEGYKGYQGELLNSYDALQHLIDNGFTEAAYRDLFANGDTGCPTTITITPDPGAEVPVVNGTIITFPSTYTVTADYGSGCVSDLYWDDIAMEYVPISTSGSYTWALTDFVVTRDIDEFLNYIWNLTGDYSLTYNNLSSSITAKSLNGSISGSVNINGTATTSDGTVSMYFNNLTEGSSKFDGGFSITYDQTDDEINGSIGGGIATLTNFTAGLSNDRFSGTISFLRDASTDYDTDIDIDVLSTSGCIQMSVTASEVSAFDAELGVTVTTTTISTTSQGTYKGNKIEIINWVEEEFGGFWLSPCCYSSDWDGTDTSCCTPSVTAKVLNNLCSEPKSGSIKLTNDAGDTATATFSAVCDGTVDVVFSAADTCPMVDYSGGATSYEMMSFPMVLADTDAVNNLGPIFDPLAEPGVYNSDIWRIYTYSSGDYVQPPDIMTDIVPGRGYWIVSLNNAAIDLFGPPVDGGTDFTLTLTPGWNMVGNPFIFTVNTADFLVDNGSTPVSLSGGTMTLPNVYCWQNEIYVTTTQLLENRGYWIKNTTAGDITLTIPANAAAPVPAPLMYAPAGGDVALPAPPAAVEKRRRMMVCASSRRHRMKMTESRRWLISLSTGLLSR